MKRVFAAIKKESLLLLRDRSGLIILFLMPVLLVIVMTMVQDITFQNIDERRLVVLLLDKDGDEFGRSVEKGLEESGYFTLVKDLDGGPLNEELIKGLVSEGKYQIGIIVREGATEAIRKNAGMLTSEMLGGKTGTDETKETGKISIYFDPVIRNSFRQTILSNLRNQISRVEMKILFESISDKLKKSFPGAGETSMEKASTITIEESYAKHRETEFVPNSVQHNIPGWAIFAMFFIVIPLTGNIIREKSEGISLRLHMFPKYRGVLISSKIIVYAIVCLLQFLVMLLVGIFIFPLLGLPALDIGSGIFSLFIMTLVTAFSAISYGMMIGFTATTHDQAASFGTVSVIILSALGGLWVPTFVMPDIMKTIASFSPLNWSLEGYYEILLRGGNLISILPYTFKLLIFTAAMILILFSVQLSKKR
jgi:ABC-2 type transport system permease protein